MYLGGERLGALYLLNETLVDVDEYTDGWNTNGLSELVGGDGLGPFSEYVVYLVKGLDIRHSDPDTLDQKVLKKS